MIHLPTARLFTFGTAFALLGAGVSLSREFTDAKGRKIDAEIISVKGEEVTIRRDDGKDYTLAIDLFSPGDQTAIRSWKPATAPPMTPSAPPVGEEVKAGATLTLEFPELPKDRKDQTAACNVRLPADYHPAKSFGLVVWLGGGDGGNQPNGSFVPEGPFVLAGLPYPKGANNPGQANMVGDYEKVWEFHRAMITRIHEKIPNLKKEWSVIGGFSNGGHSIDGMLRLREKAGALADYFGAFVIADGGGGYASEDGSYPSLEGKHAYVCWGETSPNSGPSEGVAKDFKGRRAETVASEMAATGHEFAAFEQEKVKEWLKTVVMPAWGMP
jgi:predicted esterase